MRTLKVKV